ncbi:MAG: sodium:calcium antiporter [Dehalococcoidia bacterium]|nr:sodium:calcium antiporter [Dehalococcoidia bacterium]
MSFLWIGGATAITLPALYLRVTGMQVSPTLDSALFGLAILGAAFLLTWAAEVAQLDIPQSLALAFLALIAVLPEYAVDFYFAWAAGQSPEYTHYAVANMTGGNRLIIGLGWSLVVFLFWIAKRQRGITISRSRGNDMSILALATVYGFTIPLKGSLSIVDTFFLLALFIAYLVTASRSQQVDPEELVGPSETIAAFPIFWRRVATVALFLFSATVILASAKPFAEGLLATAKGFGIDEFLLVQWLAPLASEAPEIIVASIFVFRNSASMALGTLISSKVNQWTLLVGTLPLVYSVSLGHLGALPLDSRQTAEIILTAAQSAFAVVLLLNFTLSMREAAALLFLFGAQLFFPDPTIRDGFSVVYVLLATGLLVKDRGKLRNLVLMMPWVGNRTSEE